VADKQTEDFGAAGFDALVKRWDKWRICRNISFFFSVSHVFRFISICDLYTDSLVCTSVDINVANRL
jgi:hypothetical protein